MEQIIAFINQKGGVGKTTTCASVAVAMAALDKRTLLVDLDAQCNLSASFGVYDHDVNTYSVLKGEEAFDTIRVNDLLDLLPASIDLSAFELEMSGEPGKEYLLKEILDPLRDNYDYIFLDCSPTLGLLSLNALCAADTYIIPILPHHLSIQGFTKLLDVTEKVKKRINAKLELGGIVLTQYNSHKVLHKDIFEVIQNHFDDKLFDTVIRENIALAEAPSAGVDIFRYAPKSNGAADYMQLAKEMLNKK